MQQAADNADLLQEPSAEQLASLDDGMVADRELRCWVWKHPERRKWLPRPGVFEVVPKALRKLPPLQVARVLQLAPQSVYKIAAGHFLSPSCMNGAAHQLYALTELTTEL